MQQYGSYNTPLPSDGTRSCTFRTGHIARLSNGACEGFGREWRMHPPHPPGVTGTNLNLTRQKSLLPCGMQSVGIWCDRGWRSATDFKTLLELYQRRSTYQTNTEHSSPPTDSRLPAHCRPLSCRLSKRPSSTGSLATPPYSSLHVQLAVSPRLAPSLTICFNMHYLSLM